MANQKELWERKKISCILVVSAMCLASMPITYYCMTLVLDDSGYLNKFTKELKYILKPSEFGGVGFRGIWPCCCHLNIFTKSLEEKPEEKASL